MSVRSFIHRHYSPAVGESPTGHAAAVFAGLMLIAIGGGLAVSVVFAPAGIAIGLLGVLILGAGVFGQIRRPLKWTEMMDTAVGLSGAAIALTFMIVVVAIVVGFAISVLVSTFGWLVG